MIYQLRNNRNGEEACYHTTVEILECENILTFKFVAENSKYYCPRPGYNGIHSNGDACEILIGSDLDRKIYYEIEISPKNDLMIAKMTYQGVDENQKPILKIDFVEESFIKSNVTLTPTGYIAELSFDKRNVLSGDGEMYFNVYRLETDRGETNKHLFALNPTMQGWFHVPAKYVDLKDYVEKA